MPGQQTPEYLTHVIDAETAVQRDTSCILDDQCDLSMPLAD